MAFLVWPSEKEAEDSLMAVNTLYGCPYRAENGYRMDQWDFVIKSRIAEIYGFYKPEERLGIKVVAIMPMLVPGFIESREMPEDFKLEEDDEVQG